MEDDEDKFVKPFGMLVPMMDELTYAEKLSEWQERTARIIQADPPIASSSAFGRINQANANASFAAPRSWTKVMEMEYGDSIEYRDQQILEEMRRSWLGQTPQTHGTTPQFREYQHVSGATLSHDTWMGVLTFTTPDGDQGVFTEEVFATGHRLGINYKTKKEPTMLETLIKLYSAYMLQDVRSPMPHLAGPPGVGKSTVVQQLADLNGVNLHIINVARVSPLEIEGVQMPHTVVRETLDGKGVEDHMLLKMLHSTVWTSLKEGDIVLFDEFMRGFPEVYNGFLDIMTSREVAGFKLPRVFMIGASNSVASYDPALEDRLLHITVPDIRSSTTARAGVKQMIIDLCGLNPDCMQSQELETLVSTEILPMYDVLDQFTGRGTKGSTKTGGHSIRNLVGQVKLREVQSNPLKDLLEHNNQISIQHDKAQFVILLSGKRPNPKYVTAAAKLQKLPKNKLSEVQQQNLQLNLSLIEMEQAMNDATIADEPAFKL